MVKRIGCGLRRSVGSMVGAAVAGYFAFHAVTGARGLLSWTKLRHEVARAHSLQQTVNAKREQLEAQVKELSPKTLDLDMLEERTRLMLGYIKPGERIIMLPNLPPKP